MQGRRRQASVALKVSIAMCYRAAMPKRLAAFALALALAVAAAAQPIRMLPSGGKLGELAGRQQAFPLVQIGGEVLRLQTTYATVVQSAWHVNLFSGVSF